MHPDEGIERPQGTGPAAGVGIAGLFRVAYFRRSVLPRISYNYRLAERNSEESFLQCTRFGLAAVTFLVA